MLSEGTPILRVGNLFTSNEWYYSDLELEEDKYIDNGDLIYAWSASFGPFIWDGGKVIYHYHIWKMDVFNENSLDKDFSRIFLQAISERIKASGNGIAMIHMTKERMEKVVHPLPPIEEQKRIVAKVDELMALCDQLEQQQESSISAHQTLVEALLSALTNAADNRCFEQAWSRIAENFDTLFTTEHSVDQLKQTILQLAVMGKLVPQDPSDEPVSNLLGKIAAEKEVLISTKKIKKQKAFPEVSEEETPFDIPIKWEWVRLGNVLSKITDGTHHSPPNGPQGDFLYISAKNIKNDGVLLSNATYVTKEKHDEIYSRCDPEYGDILYIKDGATTGIATINSLAEPFSMLSSVALLKCPKSILNQYLLLSLRSPYFYEEMRAGMSGVAITRVTLKKLNNAFIGLPPIEEQKRIVQKVDELITLCDEMKKKIQDSQNIQLQVADAITNIALA